MVSAAGHTELPDVPLPQIVGMRNPLVHAYFDINRQILWDKVQRALPPLIAQRKKSNR
nr:HepT-like ribonuclease domain-containing protein [uncultured Thiohalocapsa sp.]